MRLGCEFLRFPFSLRCLAPDVAASKLICSSSLEGIDLYNSHIGCSASFDSILDQCPNLRYFSIDALNGEVMRKLPLKAPKLQYLRLRDCLAVSLSYGTISPIVNDLIRVVENLPNLCRLCVDHRLYDLLLGYESIKRLCRRKKLLVTADRLSRVRDDLFMEWMHLCRRDPSM
uniref:Uncharacterized protein n=1 Tax=Romanomermis culicivorax TaxID=13658 RepID=A0A915IWJ0_ROMCU